MKPYQVWRAVLTGLAATVGALMVYQTPPSIELFWQPVLLGVSTALTTLGINARVQGPRQ